MRLFRNCAREPCPSYVPQEVALWLVFHLEKVTFDNFFDMFWYGMLLSQKSVWLKCKWGIEERAVEVWENDFLPGEGWEWSVYVEDLEIILTLSLKSDFARVQFWTMPNLSQGFCSVGARFTDSLKYSLLLNSRFEISVYQYWHPLSP